MDLCAYWFFFCTFVNMMIFHIKIKYIKIDPQSYIGQLTGVTMKSINCVGVIGNTKGM